MQIPFDFGRWVFIPGSNQEEDSALLKLTLEYFVRVNQLFLRYHHVPSLYHSGVRYGRTTNWDAIPRLYEKRYGDCKSLSAARIAELRNQGVPCTPEFRWVHNADGSRDYHILIRTPKGPEDPSKILGMNDENAYFRNAVR